MTATVTTTAIFAEWAPRYARAGWAVFPVIGKVPAIPKRLGGRGVLDATTDLGTIAAWTEQYPNTNIAARVPAGLFVLDIDPRNGGDADLAALEARHAPLPMTLTVLSGRGDGGCHRYYVHPGGELTGARLPAGIDLKTYSGYVLLPPSLHPETGRPYEWSDPSARAVSAPGWLVGLLRPQPAPPRPASRRWCSRDAHSIADRYSATATWAEILEPHGWVLVAGNGDSDGSEWRRPGKSHGISATVRHGVLFVYSTSTPFEATEAGAPHGYTRFAAHAILEYGGNQSAAARALRGSR